MLWPIVSENAKLRMIGVDITKSGSTFTINQGSDDIESLASGGTGIVEITLKDPGQARPMFFGTVVEPSTTLFGGAALRADVARTVINPVTIKIADANGVAADGRMQGIIVCFDSEVTDRVQLNDVKFSRRGQCSLMAGRYLTSGGQQNASKEFTVTDVAGNGVYDITFLRALFNQAPFIYANCSNTNNVKLIQQYVNGGISRTNAGVRLVITAATSGTASINSFSFLALGTSLHDEMGGAKTPIMNCSRQCRALAFYIKDGALEDGAQSATLATPGTGQYALTLNRPFRRTPVVLVSGVEGLVTVVGNMSESSIPLLSYAHAGGSAANGNMQALVIGWDDPSEY
jgi:hypothetical protein